MNLKLIRCVFIALLTFTVTPAYSQDEGQRASTGGAQTLEDILARQKGLDVDESFVERTLEIQAKLLQSVEIWELLGVSHSLICIVVFGTRRQTFQVSNTSACSRDPWSRMEACWLLTRQGAIQSYAAYGVGGIYRLAGRLFTSCEEK